MDIDVALHDDPDWEGYEEGEYVTEDMDDRMDDLYPRSPPEVIDLTLTTPPPSGNLKTDKSLLLDSCLQCLHRLQLLNLLFALTSSHLQTSLQCQPG